MPDKPEGLKWRQREILSQLSGGWTLEQVNDPEDRALEAKLMGNRVGPDEVPYGNTLLSLRDPDGFPLVNIVHMYGLVVQVLGPGNSRVTDPDHLGLLREHFESHAASA